MLAQLLIVASTWERTEEGCSRRSDAAGGWFSPGAPVRIGLPLELDDGLADGRDHAHARDRAVVIEVVSQGRFGRQAVRVEVAGEDDGGTLSCTDGSSCI